MNTKLYVAVIKLCILTQGSIWVPFKNTLREKPRKYLYVDYVVGKSCKDFYQFWFSVFTQLCRQLIKAYRLTKESRLINLRICSRKTNIVLVTTSNGSLICLFHYHHDHAPDNQQHVLTTHLGTYHVTWLCFYVKISRSLTDIIR